MCIPMVRILKGCIEIYFGPRKTQPIKFCMLKTNLMSELSIDNFSPNLTDVYHLKEM